MRAGSTLSGFLLAILVWLAAHQPIAQAEPEETLLFCTGSAETFYSPGLLLAPREVELSWVDSYDLCLPNNANVASGVTAGSALSEVSCLALLGEETGGSQTIEWSNGQSSVMTWTADGVTITSALGTQTYTVDAVITDGLFLGSRVTEVIVLTTPNLLGCLSEPGVTSTTGVVTLLIQSAI